MESYEQRVPILDFLYRKSGMNSQGFSVASEKLEDLYRTLSMTFNARKYS